MRTEKDIAASAEPFHNHGEPERNFLPLILTGVLFIIGIGFYILY